MASDFPSESGKYCNRYHLDLHNQLTCKTGKRFLSKYWNSVPVLLTEKFALTTPTYQAKCSLKRKSKTIFLPPANETKLQEGNVFSHFCPSVSHSVHGGIPCTVPPTPTTDICWPRLGTCSNLFTWGHPQCWNLVAIEAHMVGKRAVCIPLECFLVNVATKLCFNFQFLPDFWSLSFELAKFIPKKSQLVTKTTLFK